MSAIAVSIGVAACIFLGGLAGLLLRSVLPETHLKSETQDVVRLGTGMLSVLASLVLGLMIATAKTSFDTTDNEIRAYGADLILLAETFRDYGTEAAAPRDLLRRYTERLLHDDWPPAGRRRLADENREAATMLEHVREAIRALRPVDEGQKWLQDQALTVNTSLLRQRWLLVEQAEPSVRPVFLVVLVTWITLIFVSFGLNAPRNGTVVVAFLICSLAIGGSIFLILQLDSPFDGLMRVSSRPITTAVGAHAALRKKGRNVLFLKKRTKKLSSSWSRMAAMAVRSGKHRESLFASFLQKKKSLLTSCPAQHPAMPDSVRQGPRSENPAQGRSPAPNRCAPPPGRCGAAAEYRAPAVLPGCLGRWRWQCRCRPVRGPAGPSGATRQRGRSVRPPGAGRGRALSSGPLPLPAAAPG